MPEIFEELFHACKLILRNKNKPTVADRSFFDPVDRQSEGTVAGGQQESSDHAVHRFQERLDVLSESQKALEKDVKKQKQLVKDLQTRNQSLQEQKRTESAALHSNIEALRSKIEVLRSKIEVTEGQLRASREEGFTWENQAKKVYSQLQSLQMTYKNTKDLLERRTRELDHALSFLSKADDISHTEVLSMVEHANTLSFHLATRLADITLFSQSLDRPQPSEEANALVEGLLGKDIFELLISEKHSEDPLYFQIALQAMVTAFVAYYVNKWDRGTLLEFPGQHELLRKTHIEIFKTEPQAVSARWRALTRRCYRRIEYSENADPARTASEQLLRAIKQVIEVAGGVLPHEEPLDRVEEIIQHCFKIQRTIGEEVISTDFEVIYPDACAPWKPQVMADFDDGGRGQAKKVPDGTHTLCTVELGLQRFEKTADLEGGEEKEGYQNTALLRAKVLLPIEADDESDATVEAPKSRPVAP